MPRILKIVLPPLLALGLGLLVGFGFGQRWGLKYAEYEVLGNLSLRMEAASLIRLGDCDDALQWMEVMSRQVVEIQGCISPACF
jgi:hypothetical protein